ncbi:MAG TPA: penicillin acylase family protein, partial [Bacillales bacterium]|nr:penicillin acylase family protein [Bacillales bacterium]
MTSPVTISKRRGRRLWPRKRRWKIMLVIFIILLILLSGAYGYGYWTLQKKLPVTAGTLDVPGLSEKVEIYRDAEGVPHIEAKNEHDLFLAQGFVTAQARLFQMDLSRRQASGTLSEIVGDATVSQDKFFRTLGLRRWAKKSFTSYSNHGQDVLQWYADGVNAFINSAEKNGKLPVGFRLLGYKPKPWTPVDSLTIGKYMAFDLGGHWEGQAFRYYLLEQFPKEKAMALFPAYPENAPTIVQTVMKNPINIEKSFAEAVPVLPNPFNGSNNWVVSGKKTASGKPYLANDPHLGLATPSIWYETHLKAPGLDVSGVIFAGVPGIIIGHNQSIAWGVTNVGPDVQDLYIEKRNPANPNEFLYDGKWYKAKVIHEAIHVKDGKTIPFKVTVTRHGPIVSEFAHDSHPDTALAMKWTALQPTTELEAVLKFMKAKNWQQFKKALTYFQAPAQNFVFASEDGTIAYRANGLIPIRKNGNSLLPVPGWTDKYEWTGYIPWDKLPTVVNPPEGFISTANNKVTPDGYPYHISNIWEEPFRAERIRQVLS